MTLPRAVLGVLLPVLAAGAGAEERGADPARFGSKTALVQVDVVAVDAQGTPVEGLGIEDFELQEDGVPVEIETVQAISADALPPPAVEAGQRLWINTEGGPARSSFIVFDDVGLTPVEAEQARKGAREFLDRLPHGDVVGLASVSGRLFCTGRVPEDREGLLQALQRLSGMRSPQALGTDEMTEYEAARIVRYGDALVLERVESRMQRSSAPGSQSFPWDTIGGASEGSVGPSSAGPAAGGGPVSGADHITVRKNTGSSSSERQLAESLATQIHARANERRGRILETLARVVGSLSAREGRKAVILMTARFLEDPDDQRAGALRELARRATAVIYTIDVEGLRGGGREAGGRGGADARLDEQAALRAGLESLAAAGGGFAITGSNDLAAGLRRCSSDSRQYYLLGYRPPSPVADGKFRRITVSVRRAGVGVRSRPGYFATGEETRPEAGGGRAEPGLQLRRALDSPYELPGIPLRLASYSFEPTKGEKTRTELVTELRVDGLDFARKDGLFEAEIDVLISIMHYASGKTFGGRPVAARITTGSDLRGQLAWYRLAERVELPAGASQVRFVVRDRRNGRIGSVIATVETPPQDGKWRTSSLVLSDAVASAGEGEPQHALPQARRSFPAAGLLYSEFEVYGAAADRRSGVPRLSAGFTILRKGKTEREEPLSPLEPTRDRRFARLTAVPLARLKPGDYEFVLRLRDEVSGEERELREPFTLVRPPTLTPAGYQDLVQEYVDGRGAEALGGLFAWRASDVAELVRELEAADGPLVRAAAMLHTEAVLTLWEQRQPARAMEQLAIARELLARVERQSPFRRDWLLALGALLQGKNADETALEMYAECLESFPDTAAAWLAAGTLYEYAAFPDGLRGGGLPGEASALAKEAESRYRRALAIDPALAEAHLRLGRVLARSGRSALATAALRQATETEAEPGVEGLAHLFLGDLAERSGMADEALAHYATALEHDPTLQQAGLAQAALVERREGRTAAASTLTRVLRGGCARDLPRWLGYHLGLGERADAMVQALRRRVKP